MFYLPWKKERETTVRYQKRLYAIGGRKLPLSEIGGIDSQGQSFFSILTQKGTVNKFIHALKNKSFEEAKSMIIPKLVDVADMDALKDMFPDTSKYLCYHSHKDRNTITVAMEGVQEQMEVIYITMVKEAHTLGGWKICQIIRE